MLEQILQNFNWPTFFVTLTLVILVASAWRVVAAAIVYNRSKHQVKVVESELKNLYDQLKVKNDELENILMVNKRN